MTEIALLSADDVRCLAVVGAGQMGSGIAEVAALAGISVNLCDVSAERASAGRAQIQARLERRVEKGKLEANAASAILGRLHATNFELALKDADFVIEAASEERALKLELFRSMDAVAPERAVLTTNTSSLSITSLAAATRRPERVAGMHFMNPVPVMQLVEIVRGVATAPATLSLVRALAQRFGKTVVQSEDSPGFVVNRVLMPLINEACFALQEGVCSADGIDAGIRLGLNHPMGPLELADLIGLDTVLAICEVLHRDLGDDKYRPATVLRNRVAAGWLGRKTGRGFYRYDERGAKLATAEATQP